MHNFALSIICHFFVCLVQLIFSGGVLNGFVWQHVSSIPGDRWESVNSFGISNIVDRPPNCLYDLVESPGVTTMHVSLFLKNMAQTNSVFLRPIFSYFRCTSEIMRHYAFLIRISKETFIEKNFRLG